LEQVEEVVKYILGRRTEWASSVRVEYGWLGEQLRIPMMVGPEVVGTREGWEGGVDEDLWSYQTESFREWRSGLSKKAVWQ